MKTTKVISFILKVIGYALGIYGGLLVIGSPGALDQGSISILQFIGQEFLGILLSNLSLSDTAHPV